MTIKKKIASIVVVLVLVCSVLVYAKIYNSGVLGASRTEDTKIVNAMYYINRTGKSSKYIAFNECEEVGAGTIAFDMSIDKLTVRNSPDEVAMYLEDIPDYSPFVADNEGIKWMTIYRSNGDYRVVGEVVEIEPVVYADEDTVGADGGSDGESDEGEEDFLLILDEPVEESVGRGMPEAPVTDEEIVVEEPVKEEIIEEIIEESAPDHFDSVADLVNGDLSDGMTVYTRGFYGAGDGGDATYVISKRAGKVYEKLSNGLYANLQYDDTLNIKQLGASGNGTDDDSSYLEKAFTIKPATVLIPEGGFNLAGKSITVPNNVAIKGEGKEKSILYNLNLTAPNGITMSDITCDGAAKRSVLTPSERLKNTIMIDVSPKGGQRVSYSNCIFRNTDLASFAFADTNGYFINDEVTDCIFENIGRVAVYHSCNSDRSVYSGNHFYEIGNTSLFSGPISAIWIGDVTNNTFTKSKDIVIEGNEFKNLYTGYDFDVNSKHVLNGNFISIRGDVAKVMNNWIENLYGYGEDREALYTKINDLTIDGNTIINGGTGEGYMCNKSAEGDINAVITNNHLIGEYGAGIRQYGPAVIAHNEIRIDHCKTAIIVTARGDQTASYPVEVDDNQIYAGSPDFYSIEGNDVSGYNDGNLIKIVGPLGTTSVTNNIIYPGEEYSSYVSIGNAKGDVSVVHNTIDTSGFKGSAISIYCNSKGVVNKTQEIKLTDNILYITAGQKGLSLNFVQQNTTRSIYFDKNTFTFSNASVRNYPLSINTSGSNNKDVLEVSGNKANTAKSKTYINYSAKTLENNDDGFAVFSKR